MRDRTAALDTTTLVSGAAAAMAVLTAWALVEVGPLAAIALALSPLLAIAVVYLVTSGQAVLYVAALALSMTSLAIVGTPLVGPVVLQDVVAALALGAVIFAALLGRGRVPPVPRTPVLGWPFVLFVVVIFIATLRGHYAYGASLIGQPFRLFLYAAIVGGLIGMTVPRMHRLLVVLFYPGAVLIAFTAAYFLATGGSAVPTSDLSTGGTRPIAISTSIYCAAALFLALLNLRLAQRSRERVLHVSVALIATFGVAAGFGRAVWAAVAVVAVIGFFASRRLRENALSVVPLAVPFLVLLAIGVGSAAPELVDSVSRRAFSAPEDDANVQWRIKANEAILEQVREQPLFGVGFGRDSEFFLEVEDPTTGLPSSHRIEIHQDPHNGYLFLLAGGGILALGSLLLLLGVFALDSVRRYRATTDPSSRLIILWAGATLFIFLFNAGSGTVFENPENLLTIWALLVLPAVVQPADGAGDDSVRPYEAPTMSSLRSWDERTARRPR